MPSRKFSTVVLAIFVVVTLVTGTCAVAQTEKVLHNFNNNG